MTFQVCSDDVTSLIPSHHVANDSPPHQKNVIRTKIKMINIYNGKIEGLVSIETKIEPSPIWRDYRHI